VPLWVLTATACWAVLGGVIGLALLPLRAWRAAEPS
jgi:hypothetical protein